MNTKTHKLVAAGLLIALSIILSRVFSADLVIAGIPGARLAIGFVPIMLAGLILGPYFGLTVGIVADVLGYVIAPTGPYFPGITITSALVGLLPYGMVRISGKLPYWLQIFLAVAFTQIACSMFLQTFWLSVLYGKAFMVLFVPRVVVTLITIPIYYGLIYAVLMALKRAKLTPQPG